MPLFDNAACPVCNRIFENGDDVVFCPECGTPHHRECYDAVGHCVNRGLHASGYIFRNESMPKSDTFSDTDNAQTEPAQPQFPGFGTGENAGGTLPPIFSPNPFQTNSVYENDNQTISGESVADFAVTIRTNIPRFINIFKDFEYKGRKRSWNWGAFFFGSLYLFFRKMYRQGIAFFSAFIAVVYASCFAIMKLAPNYVEAAKNFANLYSQNKVTYEDMEALSKISDLPTANIILYITFAAILVLRIILALYADKYYKSTISEFIKRVNEKLENGASFIQTSFTSEQDNYMSQNQMKKYYLARRGGTSVFLPLMAASAAYFLISLAYYTLFL